MWIVCNRGKRVPPHHEPGYGVSRKRRSRTTDTVPGRQLIFALGTPGADCQVQSNMQVITNLIEPTA